MVLFEHFPLNADELFEHMSLIDSVLGNAITSSELSLDIRAEEGCSDRDEYNDGSRLCRNDVFNYDDLLTVSWDRSIIFRRRLPCN